MPVTIHDVDYIAALAKLSFSEDEKQKLAGQLTDILNYMEQLNSLDTTGIEPLSHVIELNNAFRDDIRTPGLQHSKALQNAPSMKDPFFKVPKVIGDR
jgi:aspartyl-tRNA(Asn)/glutamyl-tRNA(Gln) amidotransferase subunit C